METQNPYRVYTSVLKTLKDKHIEYNIDLPKWFDHFLTSMNRMYVYYENYQSDDIEYSIYSERDSWFEIFDICGDFIFEVESDENDEFYFTERYLTFKRNFNKLKKILKEDSINNNDIEVIQSELNKALKKENYEYAVILRDKLKTVLI